MTTPVERRTSEWRLEFLSVRTAAWALHHILENKLIDRMDAGSVLVFCIDTYDFIDWFFGPKVTFHDEHYRAVHNLWRTVEELLKPADPIRVCLLPGSALEVSALLRRVAIQTQRLDIGIDLGKYLPKDEFDKAMARLINRFRRTQAVLSGMAADTDQQRLSAMLRDGRVIAVDRLLPSGKIDALELAAIAGQHINEAPGREYMHSRRKFARGEEVGEGIHTLSIQVDLFNLGHTTYLNDKSERNICILSSHGWVTLIGYGKSYLGGQQVTPFTHSFGVLALLSALKKAGSREDAHELIGAAHFAARRYLDAMSEIPGLVEYMHRKGKGLPDEVAALPDKGRINLEYWKANFENEYLTPLTYITQKEVMKAKEVDVIDVALWSQDEGRRHVEAAAISEGAKRLLSGANFLNPDARTLLTPLEDPVVDDVFSWLFD